jgi:dTDP-4-dehydrorhamnose reductase
MKVLVVGARGQLGQALVAQFEPHHEVVGLSSNELDITNHEAVQQVFQSFRPEVVIQTAAWTNVDEAARQPEAAMRVNGDGTRYVAQAADMVGAHLVYLSTNEVFAGNREDPYLEDDLPGPINAYGQSKLAGEQAVEEVMPAGRWMIARVSWLYGPTSTRNFPHKILQLADERGSLKVVDDEISTPTYVPDVAHALQGAVENRCVGTLHLVNEGHCSRFDWAKMILESTGRGSIPLEPIKLADFSRPSIVPPQTILLNSQAKDAGIVLPPWQESLARYIKLLS